MKAIMHFVEWLRQKKPAPLKFGESPHDRWRVEEEARQLDEVRERLKRVEIELERIKGSAS